MNFDTPEKTAIKEKYGISNDDFDVLTSREDLAASGRAKQASFVEEAASHFGVPTFLLKNKWMVVVAIAFAPGWAPGFRDDIISFGSRLQDYYAFPPIKQDPWTRDVPRVAIAANSAVNVVTVLSNGSGTTTETSS